MRDPRRVVPVKGLNPQKAVNHGRDTRSSALMERNLRKGRHKSEIFREPIFLKRRGFFHRRVLGRGAAPIRGFIRVSDRTDPARTLNAPGGCHGGHFFASGREGKACGGQTVEGKVTLA